MTAGSGDLDWHSLAAFVSHYAPGSTDPMELPVDRLLAIAHATSDMLVRNSKAQLHSMRRIK
ncbi:hypothetical protein UFOVP1116_24 [uncultured Caudovirales phage]|uniref:Uncharacterized protein n=1 Tax=uncultured Caudovirales phage TaxID=2100421 RepID=A0A6J7XFN8_9CAUD|nr:hypothetical protein UFOVP1116_24 [uncultured Caudovirales phage]CAB4204228.1 hypothetical protein UFOVP1391_44 [uncultured Caudovirales phage]CAB4215428.1 hypothetical protein UFOVP1480_15 [uncultured Caudovirales phage]CAB5230110.1 hypothetical protein UFOVP1568_37 [uncultured Caudovirales phage]